MSAHKISRRVRTKSRRPALLPSLLAALDARPDVTVLHRDWPVYFVQLRYVLEKTVVNPNGMSPLHRETPLFYGQAWKAFREQEHVTIERIPQTASVQDEGIVNTLIWTIHDGALGHCIDPIHPEVAARLGLAPSVEREPAIVGRSLER